MTMYRVFIYEKMEGFYGCIGEYETKDAAEKRAEEARRAHNDVYYLDVIIEESHD